MTTALEEPELEILMSKVEEAIRRLKNNKAVERDEIPAKVYKQIVKEGTVRIHSICNIIWMTGDWRTDWSQSVYIPLYKQKKEIDQDVRITVRYPFYCTRA